MGLFNFTSRKPAHNPYNQLDRLTFKAGSNLTKDRANEALNAIRERLTGVQKVLLEDFRKDKTIPHDDIVWLARINFGTMPPKELARAWVLIWGVKDELIQKAKKSKNNGRD